MLWTYNDPETETLQNFILEWLQSDELNSVLNPKTLCYTDESDLEANDKNS